MEEGKIQLINVEKPEDMNFILGQSHFIKTVEDIFEAIVNTVPNAEFGIAFCEASVARKIRSHGNDDSLKKLAEKNAMNIGAGHSFIVFIKNCFPIHLLRNIKQVPEVCTIFCATSNPTKVIVIESKNGEHIGRGIMGVIDGHSPVGIEDKDDIAWRHKLLRDIGYKL